MTSTDWETTPDWDDWTDDPGDDDLHTPEEGVNVKAMRRAEKRKNFPPKLLAYGLSFAPLRYLWHVGSMKPLEDRLALADLMAGHVETYLSFLDLGFSPFISAYHQSFKVAGVGLGEVAALCLNAGLYTRAHKKSARFALPPPEKSASEYALIECYLDPDRRDAGQVVLSVNDRYSKAIQMMAVQDFLFECAVTHREGFFDKYIAKGKGICGIPVELRDGSFDWSISGVFESSGVVGRIPWTPGKSTDVVRELFGRFTSKRVVAGRRKRTELGRFLSHWRRAWKGSIRF